MGIGKQKFKSNSVEYETPDYIFKPLEKEFDIVLDVCATAKNAKCNHYFTKSDNAFSKSWHKYGNCWMNPPWGRALKKWVKKAWMESQKGITVVCLLPARTNTNWWHDYCMKGEIRFLKGEIKFKNMKRGLWMPIAIVILKPLGKSNLPSFFC